MNAEKEHIVLNGFWPSEAIETAQKLFCDKVVFELKNEATQNEAFSIADISTIISAAIAVISVCLQIIQKQAAMPRKSIKSLPTVEEINIELKSSGIMQTCISELRVENQDLSKIYVRIEKTTTRFTRRYIISKSGVNYDITPDD
jgi:hypothetical protein